MIDLNPTSKSLLSTYCASGTILNTENAESKKADAGYPCGVDIVVY